MSLFYLVESAQQDSCGMGHEVGRKGLEGDGDGGEDRGVR